MLIRFTVENFLSFKDETVFSMIPGKGTDRKKHIIKPEKKTSMPLLCSGIIYGANAAGKSNLIKAINAAQEMILNPLTKENLLPDKRFKLDKKSKKGITKFEFEIQINEKKYAYGFTFSPKQIEEEWLSIIKNKDLEIPVFERTKNVIELNPIVIKKRDDLNRFKFIREDLFPNQLFLSIVNNRNISSMKCSESFVDVNNWFKESLTIVFPDSKFQGVPILGGKNNFSKIFDTLLVEFDTGIVKTDFISVPIEQVYKKVPQFLVKDIELKIQSGKIIPIFNSKNDLYLFSKVKNKLKVEELITYHNEDKETYFEMSEESDGTNRLIDILPLVLSLYSEKNKVIFIDEIDRSFHTELSYKFIDLLLKIAEKNNAQIIATTHDTGLLDFKLFRKDEIWFVEKDKSGSSKVYSLEQFTPRPDLNIEKGYLNGRFGAIPFFGRNLDSFVDSFKGGK